MICVSSLAYIELARLHNEHYVHMQYYIIMHVEYQAMPLVMDSSYLGCLYTVCTLCMIYSNNNCDGLQS